MIVQERTLKENNFHSILFSIPRGNQSIKKIVLKFVKKMFLPFEKCSIMISYKKTDKPDCQWLQVTTSQTTSDCKSDYD